MGYVHTVKVKMIPDNGAIETVTLTGGFATAGGDVTTVLVENDLTYEPIQDDDETLNRDLRVTSFGFRPEVRLKFDIREQAHLRTVLKIANRCLDPNWRVLLSLDSGSIYREVILRKMKGPEPFKGKTVAGARWELLLGVKTPVPDLRYIEAGTAW